MDTNTCREGNKDERARLFSVVPSDRTRGNLQAETQEVPSEHKETVFFTATVTEHWHRSPREVVESPTLELFKSHLDMVLGVVALGGPR